MPARKRKQFIPCCEKFLPENLRQTAARCACAENPANGPPADAIAKLFETALVNPQPDVVPNMIAVMTSKYWGNKGRAFGVRFLDNPTQACRNKILAHMNAWSERCNVSFRESSQGEIRISRGATGYWSYLGTDILSIPSNQPTMNLQGFTENTREDEYKRVVRHETGHTLGCPHEHMRAAIIELLDAEKTIRYFAQTQGWSRQQVIQQVLTAANESTLLGSPTTDQDSIMCYQLPASITKNGRPIVGGSDITANDYDWMSKLYPKPEEPNPPVVDPKPADEFATVPAKVADIIKALAALGYKVTK